MWIIKSETALSRDEFEQIAEQVMNLNQRGSYVMLPAGISMSCASSSLDWDSGSWRDSVIVERCDYCGSGRSGVENCKNCGAPRPTPAHPKHG